jgi:hypothetical protein
MPAPGGAVECQNGTLSGPKPAAVTGAPRFPSWLCCGEAGTPRPTGALRTGRWATVSQLAAGRGARDWINRHGQTDPLAIDGLFLACLWRENGFGCDIPLPTPSQTRSPPQATGRA